MIEAVTVAGIKEKERKISKVGFEKQSSENSTL